MGRSAARIRPRFSAEAVTSRWEIHQNKPGEGRVLSRDRRILSDLRITPQSTLAPYQPSHRLSTCFSICRIKFCSAACLSPCGLCEPRSAVVRMRSWILCCNLYCSCRRSQTEYLPSSLALGNGPCTFPVASSSGSVAGAFGLALRPKVPLVSATKELVVPDRATVGA